MERPNDQSSKISSLKLGGKIVAYHSAGLKTGSIGCFVSRKDDNEHKYCTTAQHVALFSGKEAQHVDDGSEGMAGTITKSTTEMQLDTSLIQITKGTVDAHPNRVELKDGSIIKITQVWDPTQTVDRKKNAEIKIVEDSIKQETLQVSHLGQALLAPTNSSQIGQFNGVVQYGLVEDKSRTLKMTGRTTYAGDSGGPVFTADGVLVGFIKTGGSQGSSNDTTIAIAYYVFKELDLTLIK